MVEIEEVKEEPSPPPSKDTTEDGWQKLMGDDLVMKVGYSAGDMHVMMTASYSISCNQ